MLYTKIILRGDEVRKTFAVANSGAAVLFVLLVELERTAPEPKPHALSLKLENLSDVARSGLDGPPQQTFCYWLTFVATPFTLLFNQTRIKK